MRVVSVRKRAEEFAAAVDGRTPGNPVRDEHRAFLDLVEQLRGLEEPVLREDFASDLRERLMAAAPDALSAETRPVRTRRDASIVTFPSSPRRRTVSAAAAAFIVLGSGVGVAAASQSALPGDALYPLKRGIEHVEVAVAGSQRSQGSELLEQADTRLSEVNDLAVAHPNDPSTPTRMRSALDDFSDQANDGADKLMAAYRADHDDATIVEVRQFADESAQQLDALSGTIPAVASQALADAATTVEQLDQQARELCSLCSDLPTLTLSGALIDVQHNVSAPQPSANSPGSGPTAGVTAPTQGQGGGPTNQQQTEASSQPQGTGDPNVVPVLPQITSLLGGGGSTQDPGSTNQPATQQPPSVGVTVRLPGGGVTVNLPSVPIPTIDPNDPIGSIPHVIHDITSGVGLPDLP